MGLHKQTYTMVISISSIDHIPQLRWPGHRCRCGCSWLLLLRNHGYPVSRPVPRHSFRRELVALRLARARALALALARAVGLAGVVVVGGGPTVEGQGASAATSLVVQSISGGERFHALPPPVGSDKPNRNPATLLDVEAAPKEIADCRRPREGDVWVDRGGG